LIPEVIHFLGFLLHQAAARGIANPQAIKLLHIPELARQAGLRASTTQTRLNMVYRLQGANVLGSW